ncbi:MAG: carbon starvation CstA 5TM domain-containing protein, partial [Gemmatimonadales bacterium]
TTMDTGVRLQRYIVSELAVQYRMPALGNRWLATGIAVVACAALALGLDRGAGGMRLWPLFGTTNQLTGALTLLVITLFLKRLGRPIWVTAVPMVFLLAMTTWAMVINLMWYWTDSQTLLFGVGGVVFVLELWLVLEAWAALRKRAP